MCFFEILLKFVVDDVDEMGCCGVCDFWIEFL